MLLCLKPSQGPPSYSEKGPGSCRSWDPVPSPLPVPLWPRHPPPPRAALFLASSGFSRSSRPSPAWGFGASSPLPLLLRTPFLRLSAWLTLSTVRSLFKCPLLNGTNCPRSGGLQASLPSTSAHGATHLPPFLCHLLITFVCDSSSLCLNVSSKHTEIFLSCPRISPECLAHAGAAPSRRQGEPAPSRPGISSSLPSAGRCYSLCSCDYSDRNIVGLNFRMQ